MAPDDQTTLYPEPSFWVYSPSGRAVGYGSRCDDDSYEVYPPGGEDAGYCGVIHRTSVEFSSGVPTGRIEGSRIYYEDGVLAGEIRGNQCFDHQGKLAARIEGEGPSEAFAGAALLLVFCRWFNADGSLNMEVQ